MKRLAAVLAASFLLSGAALAADGKALFAAKCAACHGADGKGATPVGKSLGVKDLTITKLDAAGIESMVKKGKGKMAGFEGKLPAEDIKAIAGFVKGGLK
jgi:mono/diheme cytochrome c family protein